MLPRESFLIVIFQGRRTSEKYFSMLITNTTHVTREKPRKEKLFGAVRNVSVLNTSSLRTIAGHQATRVEGVEHPRPLPAKFPKIPPVR